MQVRGESLSTSLLIAFLATTRSGAESSAIGYQRTSIEFGLKVSLPKTKQMVTGRTVQPVRGGGEMRSWLLKR